MRNEPGACPAYPMERDRGPFAPPSALVGLQDDAPVSRVTLWDGSTPWIVTRYDDVRAILADQRISGDTSLPTFPHMSAAMAARHRRGRTFINMDDPEHAVQRRKLTADFAVKRIEALRPKVQDIVDGLIDEMLEAPKPVDLVEALALPVPSLVICELLGVPYEDRARFHRLSNLVNSGTISAEEAAAAMEELLVYLGALVDRKEADPEEDLLSRLAVEEVGSGQMTRDEVVKMARLLLVAGHDTTANMIALGTVVFLDNPAQLAKLREAEDPQVVANAVEEMLRYLTVTHLGRRRVALEPLEFCGQDFRSGDGVIAAADIANRDPRAFPDPDTLDIDRRARHHIAFGFGIHQCLGQPLARLELQVVFGTLYRRIPTLALAVPASDLRYKHDMAVYGVHEVPVTW